MLPGTHILAGLLLGFRHRRELARILEETAGHSSVPDLKPQQLKSVAISVLALDFDGVLAPHGDKVPLPAAHEWLRDCAAVFEERNIFILSNKPTEERQQWFAQHFPQICFIGGVRKKPFPDGLNRIRELSGVPPHSVLMVDDRLLTGCLAAILAGVRPVYIRAPYISFRLRPCAELFFVLLRSSERLFIHLAQLFPEMAEK